jgi:tripartite-type tricarboxylate transporter receptor subunit TctC
MVAVHPNLAAKTLPQLVDLIKTQPGKHSYSSPGAGTTPHLSGEMFRMAFNLDLRHVPYGGAGPQVLSILGGQVPIGFASVPSFAQQVKSGQLRGLAVTASMRMSALPDVPSTGELGMKGLTGDTFQGIFARAGTPQPILTRLHAEITKALALPDVREKLGAIGFEPCSNTPEQFTAQVKSDIERWGKVIRAAGIKAE